MSAQDACRLPRPQNVYLLSADQELKNILTGLWDDGQLRLTCFERGRGAIEVLFNELPDLLIVDHDLPDMPGLDLVNLVKSENVYRQLPVILVIREESLLTGADWCSAEVDDLIVWPSTPARLKARVYLTIARASRAFDANPLSKLPGNTSIIQRIQEMIDRREDFALAYADLDYFKSFNDKYGFSRGDEVLMMSARIIVNTIRGFTGVRSFVGHVGGDDFVFILPPDKVELACQRIVENFDSIVPHFYDEDDRAKGYIQSTDREGNMRTFPLMAISIAVVFNIGGRLKHYGEASQIAMTLKKKAKENPKSNYVLDKRQA
ncbi:Response regulator PleD [Fundidesulfovibrio magnetotacticus]|uniref:diguanylate cyclase n=1 Tax=Fundidesulfovibrio magnetotacticus TaxID=2730080 RepID=A0A6V8LY60_9BACT|nr:diguanylate cyclase [Fundidesulfovibrio magnetotacticus]GFK95531.1 Response regulator PleD [Fundidesulfovibrio magnetotacticus]